MASTRKASKFLSRKLISTYLFAILGFILVQQDKLAAEWYMTALIPILGLYIGGNVLSRDKSTQNGNKKSLGSGGSSFDEPGI